MKTPHDRIDAIERAVNTLTIKALALKLDLSKADWKEEDHPRADDGKFGSGSGSHKEPEKKEESRSGSKEGKDRGLYSDYPDPPKEKISMWTDSGGHKRWKGKPNIEYQYVSLNSKTQQAHPLASKEGLSNMQEDFKKEGINTPLVNATKDQVSQFAGELNKISPEKRSESLNKYAQIYLKRKNDQKTTPEEQLNKWGLSSESSLMQFNEREKTLIDEFIHPDDYEI